MSATYKTPDDPDQPEIYQIRIKGCLDNRWAARFEGMTCTPEDTGNTVLTVPVVDQAALHGLLRKVRDLGMPLISVTRLSPCPDQAVAPQVKH
jgi:hypothetical protein